MKEEDLFEPIKRLFIDMGYKINAEVKDCDITATKDHELIIIEMKRNMNVTLLAQALNRQKTGAKVFVAIPKPKNFTKKSYRDTLYLLKKLELGLILVSFRGEFSFAEIIAEPKEFFPPSKNYSKRKSIIKEIEGRTIDTNTGGVRGKKIVTAYTEKCIHIACLLDCNGPMTVRDLKKHGSDEKTYNILNHNVYGWFEKLDRFTYKITKKGQVELMDYPELEKYYTELIRNGEN